MRRNRAVLPLAALIAGLITPIPGVPTSEAFASDPQVILHVDNEHASCDDVDGDPFCSIQAAIDAAEPGDRVEVAAGYYEENQASFRDLFIDKSLDLVGAGSGDTVVGLSEGKTNGVEIRGASIADVLIEGITFTRRNEAEHASNFALRFGEATTTFDSLTLRDIEVSWALSRNVFLDGNGVYHDVRIEDSSFHTSGSWGFAARGTINSMHIEDSSFDGNGWNDAAHGIGFDIDQPTTASTITVVGGSFSNNTKKGINLTNVTDATFTGVTANGNEQGITLYEWRGASADVAFVDCFAHDNALDGVFVGRQDAFTIDGVTIDGCDLQSNGRAGIFLWRINDTGPPSSGIEITGNHLEGNGAGILVQMPTVGTLISGNQIVDNSGTHGGPDGGSGAWGIQLQLAEVSDVSANTILSSDRGIGLQGSSDTTVFDNVIADNDIFGLFIGGGAGANDISHNDITGNAVGIWSHSNVGTDNSANRNAIHGNTVGVSNLHASTSIDASCNWWGHSTGPGPDAFGEGDTISAGVDFVPWLTSDDLAGPCTGNSITFDNVPDDIEMEAEGPTTIVSFAEPDAEDLADGSLAVECAPESGSGFAVGDTEVVCSAEDQFGNIESVSFTVTIVDTTPGELSGMPEDMTVGAEGPGGAIVEWPAPTAVDLVDGELPVSCVPASGSLFPVGETTVECSATDSEGNTTSETFTVTIVDMTPPTVGLVDVSQGMWHLRSGAGDVTTFFFGNPGDVPFVGDWNCDGVRTPGMYRQPDGSVYLRNSNTQGVADITFFFGNPGDVPIVGDFNNNGCETVSIYRPSNQTFYVINALGEDGGALGAAESSFVFGNPGDKPFTGDFNGNGQTTVGLHRESTGLVYFRNTLTTGVADHQFFFGDPGDRLVAGDWNSDGSDSPGVFRPGDTTFYFRFTNTQGSADDQFIWGQPGWTPVAGRFGLDP